MRWNSLLLAAAVLAGCASAPLTDSQVAGATDVGLCTVAGRAYALNDAEAYARLTGEIDRRATRSNWFADNCLTYAEMGARQIKASSERRAALASAMRQVGQQLQQAGTPPPTVNCTSRAVGSTVQTTCD